MADDGDGDEPKNEPTQLPLRPRPPRPVGVPAPLPRDTRGQLGAQRVAFTRTYLGMLQEPDIVNHIRELLTKGTAREIAALLTPLAHVLFPKEEKHTGPVQVNLVHGVPRPPLDVTPP